MEHFVLVVMMFTRVAGNALYFELSQTHMQEFDTYAACLETKRDIESQYRLVVSQHRKDFLDTQPPPVLLCKSKSAR